MRMSGQKQHEQFEAILDIPADHCLELISRNTHTQNGIVYETCWLDEKNASAVSVSRFRTWTNRSSQPPYRRQQGWERFSMKGELLDREVRYSKREDMQYLH